MEILHYLHEVGVKETTFNHFDWPDKLGIEVYDYRLTAVLDNGKKVQGRGTHQNKAIAIKKAIGECVERIFFSKQRSKINSNGWAAHTCLNSAYQNAFFELVERDLYLCHFLTRTPFIACHNGNSIVPEWLQNVMRRLESKYELETKIGVMGNPSDEKISSCSFSIFGGNKFGVVTTQACASTFQEAVEKSALECYRNVAYLLLRPLEVKGLSKESFLSQRFHTPFDHFRLGLASHSVECMKYLYSSKSQLRPPPSTDIWEKTSYEVLSGGANKRFHIVRARNDDMQDMFFGPSRKEVINLPRLRRFSGSDDLSYEDLEISPHVHH